MAVLSRVREAQPELEDLIDRLLAPVPVPARGVALVRLLLRDGAGPLFRYESEADLCQQVRLRERRARPGAGLARLTGKTGSSHTPPRGPGLPTAAFDQHLHAAAAPAGQRPGSGLTSS